MRDARPSDGTLTRRYLAGDETAIEALFRRHRPSLLALYLHVGCDPMTAEDLAQEAFLRAVVHLDRFDPDRPMWPWLRRIAIHLHADHLRRGRELPVAFPETADPSTDLDGIEDAQPVAEAMSRLTPRHREALRLRYVEERKGAEAASALGVSVAAFNQLVFRARERLRDEYFRLVDGLSAALVLPARWVVSVRARTSRDGRAHAAIAADGVLGHVASGVVAAVLVLGAAPVAPGPADATTPEPQPRRRMVVVPPVGVGLDLPHPKVGKLVDVEVTDPNFNSGGQMPTKGRLPGGLPDVDLPAVDPVLPAAAAPNGTRSRGRAKILLDPSTTGRDDVHGAACQALGIVTDAVPTC